MRGDYENRGGSFDLIFGVDSYWLIMRAAGKKKEKILREQFERNCEVFLKCMDDMDFTYYHYMNELIRQMDEEFYKGREQEELARQQKELTNALMDYVYPEYGQEMKKYLDGEIKVEELYPFWKGTSQIMGQSKRHWDMLHSYREFYGYDIFCKRCEAALIISGGFNNFNYLLDEGELKEERVRELFRAMDELGLSLFFQMRGFADMYFSLQSKEKWRMLCLPAGEEPLKEELIRFCQDPSEEVKDTLVEILCRAKNHEADVVRLLASQVEDERMIAIGRCV